MRRDGGDCRGMKVGKIRKAQMKPCGAAQRRGRG